MADWSWWLQKLAGAPLTGTVDTPQPGFYREPRKAHYGARKTYRPVAYWPENGTVKCRIGDDDVDDTRAMEMWNKVNKHPVSEEAYRAVAQDGLPWPDEHELVPMGDNEPPDDISFEGIRDAIEPLAVEAKKRIGGPPIQTQDEADQIANLADRLAQLWKHAEVIRRVERKPHDQALTAIQKMWSPVLAAAETYKNLKYKLLTPWLQRQTEIAKQEAEAAAAAGQPAAAESRRPRAGSRGRAMSLKQTKKAQINDYAICLEFFKDSDDIKSCVQMLANRAVRSGITVPGTTVIEEERAV